MDNAASATALPYSRLAATGGAPLIEHCVLRLVLRLDPDSEIAMHGLAIDHPSASVSGGTGTRTSVPARRLGLASKLAWCTAGFLIGAAFWHVIGFWSFISYVVLGGPGPQATFASARPLAVASIDQVRTSATPATGSRPSCITLALDRATGRTRREPCDATAPPLPHVAASPREDLALLPGESSPTILPHSTPGAAASSRAD